MSESLESLEESGVRIPQQGRHRKALSLLQQMNRAPDQVDLTDRDLLNRIAETHRTAWETFLIAVTARELKPRARAEDLFTKESLQLMMGGAATEAEERDFSARNKQFELFIGAQLRLGGADVTGGEPDLRLLYGQKRVGIAAKRISSLASKQLKVHIDKAADQIRRSRMPGWIAINLDSRFRDLDINQSFPELVADFSDRFDQLDSALSRHYENSEVLGLIAFGYAAAWLPPSDPEDSPRLHIASPLRWVRWSNDPADAQLHADFTHGWRSRLDRRLENLSSTDFQGSL